MKRFVDRWERGGRAAFGVKPNPTSPRDEPPPNRFSGVAGFLAGGSTVVAGGLTFLGIRGDALDRLLRTEPNAFLVFGAMMALGLTAGLVAQKVAIPGSIRSCWIILGAAFALGVFPSVANLVRSQAEDVDLADYVDVLIPTAAVAVVLLVLVGGLRLDNNGGMLVLGGLLFALGAYGLVRLAVDSKDGVATPQFDAPRSDGPSIVADWSVPGLMQITATATDDAGPALASVFALGRSAADCQVLTYTVVPVSDAGDLSATIPVVVPSTVLEVEIRAGYSDELPDVAPDRYACGDVPELGASMLVLRRDSVPATDGAASTGSPASVPG